MEVNSLTFFTPWMVHHKVASSQTSLVISRNSTLPSSNMTYKKKPLMIIVLVLFAVKLDERLSYCEFSGILIKPLNNPKSPGKFEPQEKYSA